MAEETSPCSRLTPFVLAETRIANAVMLKLPLSLPSASASSGSQPTSRTHGSRYFCTSLRSKVSLPAGTGVCVVKTVVFFTAASASTRLSPIWTRSRARSSVRNEQWPSFMCHTDGWIPSARSARTPPMPCTISWHSRISRPRT